MERRVAEHDSHRVAVFGHDVLHHRVEGAAGFAGGVEEFNDGHRSLLRPQDRRVRSHQGLRLFRRDRCGHGNGRGTGHIPGRDGEDRDSESENGEDERLAGHERISFRDAADKPR